MVLDRSLVCFFLVYFLSLHSVINTKSLNTRGKAISLFLNYPLVTVLLNIDLPFLKGHQIYFLTSQLNRNNKNTFFLEFNISCFMVLSLYVES